MSEPVLTDIYYAGWSRDVVPLFGFGPERPLAEVNGEVERAAPRHLERSESLTD